MTQTQTISTDLTPSEVADLLLCVRGLNPEDATTTLSAAWPNTFSDSTVAEWWLGYLSACYDAQFGFLANLTEDEILDAEFPFFAGYRAAQVAR
jgi:hypothetical protein